MYVGVKLSIVSYIAPRGAICELAHHKPVGGGLTVSVGPNRGLRTVMQIEF